MTRMTMMRKNVTTFVLDISNTIPRISHSVMHKQSWLLLLLGPSVYWYIC